MRLQSFRPKSDKFTTVQMHRYVYINKHIYIYIWYHDAVSTITVVSANNLYIRRRQLYNTQWHFKTTLWPGIRFSRAALTLKFERVRSYLYKTSRLQIFTDFGDFRPAVQLSFLDRCPAGCRTLLRTANNAAMRGK